jgi:hypothetical protein
MTTTKAPQTAEGAPHFLTPEEVARVVKAFRKVRLWTQENLAVESGLPSRTIQRVEKGEPSSITTRRALGRAIFGPDGVDFLNTPQVFPSDEELRKKQEAYDREYLVLDVQQVTGCQLLTLMQDPSSDAIAPMSLSELPRPAQDIFATIGDFVRDCMDVFDVATRTQILGYGDTLDENIAELDLAGFCLCAAFRDTKLTSDTGTGKTLLPWSCRITYLLVGSKDKPPEKVAVLRNAWGSP